MINGVFVLFGIQMDLMRLKSSITTEYFKVKNQMTKLLEEIHPGEILLEDFMKPMGITARQLASDIDVPPSRISDIVHGRRQITADTAFRLGLFFSMEPRFWMNLQTEYDLRVTQRDSAVQMSSRIRVYQAA
jgi:antitoxin HigA-1